MMTSVGRVYIKQHLLSTKKDPSAVFNTNRMSFEGEVPISQQLQERRLKRLSTAIANQQNSRISVKVITQPVIPKDISVPKLNTD